LNQLLLAHASAFNPRLMLRTRFGNGMTSSGASPDERVELIRVAPPND
jgi:hypothetical protein